MPAFHKRGAAYSLHTRPANPNGQYAKTLRAQLQQKLEALTKPPQPVTTLKQMSPEKQAAMQALYLPPGDTKIPKQEVLVDAREFNKNLCGQVLAPKPLKTLLEEP